MHCLQQLGECVLGVQDEHDKSEATKLPVLLGTPWVAVNQHREKCKQGSGLFELKSESCFKFLRKIVFKKMFKRISARN